MTYLDLLDYSFTLAAFPTSEEFHDIRIRAHQNNAERLERQRQLWRKQERERLQRMKQSQRQANLRSAMMQAEGTNDPHHQHQHKDEKRRKSWLFD